MFDLSSVRKKIESKSFFSKTITVAEIEFVLNPITAENDLILREMLELATKVESEGKLATSELLDYNLFLIGSMIKSIDGKEVPENVEVDGSTVSGAEYVANELRSFPDTFMYVLLRACQDFMTESSELIGRSVQYNWFGNIPSVSLPEESKKESGKAKKSPKKEALIGVEGE